VKAFVTGGTGFIGRNLVRALADHGADVVVISRGRDDPWRLPRVRMIQADPTRPGDWQAAVSGCTVVFNLAGTRIVDPPHRWNERRKADIRDSRVATTINLVQAIRTSASRPAALVSQSGVDYYGSRGDDVLDETAASGDGFLAQVCREWEAAAKQAEDVARVSVLRTAIVLGRTGGALQPMLTPFKLGLGGPWGSGRQWWPWIHMTDVVGLMLFVCDRALTGAINVAAPNPVTVEAFARELGSVLQRPARARIPDTVLKLALGEAAEVLLDSKRVVPARALAAGYQFAFPTLGPALADATAGA
jgi:uncharacterized protein (TIGR01777 family)